MYWLALVTSGIFEMLGVTMMGKLKEEKNKKNLLLLFLFFTSSFTLLSYVMKYLPMATAYAIWTGIGSFGGALMGIIFFKESKSAWRILFICVILLSVIALKIIS